MPLLVCSAQKCVFNDGMYCSKGDIQVDGENAATPQETCCFSFKERQAEAAKSSMGTPSQTIDIDCKAQNCKYNHSCKCHAEKVGIIGAAACNCEQTECGTFDKN